MTTKTIIEDEHGRKYQAYTDGDSQIIIGPPEGLVDELGLPEPLATNLHNELFNRGIINFETAMQNPNGLMAAWQKTLRVDVQRLLEALRK